MIHSETLPHLERLSRYFAPPMLMLGATGSTISEYPQARDFFARWVGDQYADLDLDDADLRLDLNDDIGRGEEFATVFNLGTIEHVWNVHNAWSNALRMVRVGGYFVSASPILGYLNHGLHLTFAPTIRAFVAKNGFEVVEEFTTRRKVGDNLWLAARKMRHITELADFEPAWQVYEQGAKKAVR